MATIGCVQIIYTFSRLCTNQYIVFSTLPMRFPMLLSLVNCYTLLLKCEKFRTATKSNKSLYVYMWVFDFSFYSVCRINLMILTFLYNLLFCVHATPTRNMLTRFSPQLNYQHANWPNWSWASKTQTPNEPRQLDKVTSTAASSCKSARWRMSAAIKSAS